jgi:hypothetical protein
LYYYHIFTVLGSEGSLVGAGAAVVGGGGAGVVVASTKLYQ